MCANHVVGRSVIDMQYTTNYNLKKPEAGDEVSPSPFNENADSIDSKLKQLEDSFNQLNTSVGQLNVSVSQLDTELGQLDSELGQLDSEVSSNTSAISILNGKVKNITISTANPSGGSNGDIWIKYS